MRIGHGYDVHRLVEGRDLILGGVKIDYEKGLDGHSDADVLLHAVSDALLGAAARCFPARPRPSAAPSRAWGCIRKKICPIASGGTAGCFPS